jgi:hypothetical protein
VIVIGHFGTYERRGTSPTVSGFTITGGTDSGVKIISSEATLSGCVFRGNTAVRGGGVYSFMSSPTITNCLFEGNVATEDSPIYGGGGVYAWGGEVVEIVDSTFRGNFAHRGGGIHTRGLYNTGGAGLTTTISNCTFIANSADHGSGVFLRDSSPTIVNCILAFSEQGGPVHCCEDASEPVTSYCCSFGNAGGDSLCGTRHDNIFVDPALCDTTGGVFLLQDCSPCVGGGAGGATIGAWGVGCPCFEPSGVCEEGAAELVVYGCHPNPTNRGVTVSYGVWRSGVPVTLRVFDVGGRVLAEMRSVHREAGRGEMSWDGRGPDGNDVPSGVYFCEISAGHKVSRARAVIVR